MIGDMIFAVVAMSVVLYCGYEMAVKERIINVRCVEENTVIYQGRVSFNAMGWKTENGERLNLGRNVTCFIKKE